MRFVRLSTAIVFASLAVTPAFPTDRSDLGAVSGQTAPVTDYRTVAGTVTLIDLERLALDGPARVTVTSATDIKHIIAIPSMGIRLCAAFDRIAPVADISIGDMVAGRGRLNEDQEVVPCESVEDYVLVTGSHVDAALGFRFSYRKGPDGYLLVDNGEDHESGLLTALSLANRAEYEVFQAAGDAREGPAFMQIRVFENTQKVWPAVWALRNPRPTNYGQALAEPVETVVSGANAIHFVADGLWPVDTYVVAHDSMIFLLQAMIPDDAQAMKSDFKELVDSFEFIRPALIEDGD